MLAGCSMSMFGGGDAPVATGSIAPTVDVQRPLPPTLAYSDAAKIGEAAKAALMQATSDGDWINVATGSSGKVETVDLPTPPGAENCRPFSTTVTSIGGVHEYAGAICGDGAGRPRVTIDERSIVDRT
jgi:hypothetical protein